MGESADGPMDPSCWESTAFVLLFPQAKLAGFSFRAGVHTALEVRKIGRNAQNQTIRIKNGSDQVAKTCPTSCKNVPDQLQKRARPCFVTKSVGFSGYTKACGVGILTTSGRNTKKCRKKMKNPEN